MRKPKILAASVTLTALLLAIVALPITASSTATPLSDILPSELYGVLELDPAEVPNSLQDLYMEGLSYVIDSGLNPYYYTEEGFDILTDFYRDLYGNQPVTVGVTASSLTPAAFIITEIEEGNFENLIDLYGPYISDMISVYLPMDEDEIEEIEEVEVGEDYEDIIKGMDEYTYWTDGEYYQTSYPTSYLMYHEGYLVISNEASFLEGLYEGYSDTLTENSEYAEVADEFLDDNFLSVFVDAGDLLNDVGLGGVSEINSDATVLEALKAFGFSLEISRKGLSAQEYVISDSGVLDSLGIDYDKNLTVPHLYESMPSSNPIFYFEGFNIGENWDSFSDVSESSENIEGTFRAMMGAGISDYLVPILSQGASLLVQDSGNLFPSINVLIEVEDNEDLAQTIIDNLAESFTTNIDEEVVNVEISEEELFGGDFTVVEIVFIEEESKNPYAIYTPEEWRTISLTMGITEDSKLMISSNPNIVEEYGEDLINDDDFDIAFNENGGEVSYVGYFNFENIGDWGRNILSEYEDYDPMGIADFETANDAIKQFFSVFEDVHFVTTQTNDYTSAESDWNFDLDEIPNLVTYFTAMQESVAASFSILDSSTTDFSDVEAQEWYGDDVYYLATEGIVTGYGSDTYEPSGDITRAEFLTMLMRVLEKKGYNSSLDWYCWDCDDFSDVYYYDWYGSYVYGALDLEIISGYEDGTFHPDELITRAEAVTMLNNALAVVDLDVDISEEELEDFSDVDQDDWYYSNIRTVRQYGIVQGATETTFEPSRNLNRAESAKIIRLTLELIQ
jgi:hypothetical protein